MTTSSMLLALLLSAFLGRHEGGKPIFFSIGRECHFSSPDLKDHFELMATGEDTLTSRIHFSILSSRGDTLYSYELGPSDILGALNHQPTPTERRERIARLFGELQQFLSDDKFLIPALPPGAEYENDNVNFDRSDWEDIASDQTAVGFRIVRCVDLSYYVAYSKAKDKVVRYLIICCP